MMTKVKAAPAAPTGAVNLRGVPLDLRRRFKALCAARGMTITEALIESMRRDVRTSWGDAGPRDE